VPALQRAWNDEQASAPDRLHHRFGQPVQGLKVVSTNPAGHAPSNHVEVDTGIVDTFDLAVVAEGGVFTRDEARPEVDIKNDSPRWGAQPIRRDYRQTAWVGTVALSGAEAGLAVERFTRQGPVALLPLPPSVESTQAGLSRASLVWCVDAEHDPVADLDDAQRMAVLNALLPPRAGRIEQIGVLKSFPLGLQAQKSLVRSGCLVRIGNAAQTLHPVAGQGLNLGLRDAHALVERLRGAQRRGETTAQALSQVNWARAADRWSMIAATDFLARSFTWALPGAATARALGLLAVEHLPGLKPALARQMMFGRR
jgi:2-octaprenyl-6-methoxyphenol hydroxylase